jgi:LmbE family N-acetylglucosaminyl deacetylase
LQAGELLIPALHDHQDHRTVHEEAIRACRMREIDILAYGQPWSQRMTPFVPNYFVDLSYRHVATKCHALKAFRSQAHKPYMDENYTIACALWHGIHVAGRFAEAFEVVRWGA